jgi:hypothetical protein
MSEDSGDSGNSNLFSLFFGASKGDRKNKAANKATSSRELSLSRALELTQSRASQLVAELNATKEAHQIVLDTKDSVLRSLVKQNSQLSGEVSVRISPYIFAYIDAYRMEYCLIQHAYEHICVGVEGWVGTASRGLEQHRRATY